MGNSSINFPGKKISHLLENVSENIASICSMINTNFIGFSSKRAYPLIIEVVPYVVYGACLTYQNLLYDFDFLPNDLKGQKIFYLQMQLLGDFPRYSTWKI